jgi:hypothetical protein
VLVGGLFDHLNNADKTMLTLGALVAERNVTVAVAEGPDMLQHIEFKSLLQSYGQRVTAVEGFVRLVNPDIKVTITPMFTPLGPAADLRDLECIVIDQEDTEAAPLTSPITPKGSRPRRRRSTGISTWTPFTASRMSTSAKSPLLSPIRSMLVLPRPLDGSPRRG